MKETANRLWQTPGVTGIAIWESIWDSDSKFHLFTKRRLADWEKQTFAQLLAGKLNEYLINPENTQFKVMGNYVRLHIEAPFPPLAILTQMETLQLPDMADLLLGMQQDCQQAIAIFESLADLEKTKSNQKLSTSRFFGEEIVKKDTKVISDEPAIEMYELIDAFNELINYCSKYIGKSIALKYLENNRPQDICLSKFKLDKSLTLRFEGNPEEKVTPHLKEVMRLWTRDFIKEASSVFTYLPKTLLERALSERHKSILFA